MTKHNSMVIRVPATTANMGPGFDCLGMALSLYNEFEFKLSSEATTFKAFGVDGKIINLPKDNLLYQSFVKVYEHIGEEIPQVQITVKVGVPMARGLGSSATAIVGGLLGANYFAKNPLSSQELTNLAIALEGHPDNVIPAFMGNCILSVGSGDNWHFVPIPVNPDIAFVLAIPDFELSTEEARGVLPKNLTYSDSVFNIAHLGLLLRALQTGKAQWLAEALKDKLHQPYRRALIKGYDELEQAVLSHKGYGMVISGAGPTLLALCPQNEADNVAQAMEKTWQGMGVKAKVRSLLIDTKGAGIIDNEQWTVNN
ncbi:homoserine kinase [Cyanobacterium stanieri LEGE 03274]|uniref:Homoserine kinase n=1 Tax=Cyanobacterium stanieri LEGE 03274 TaxID=1828756 RepID=A0ABR9V602_9CHRO|nr:homoserine kinase [Cyanobacterium stanieri]MBE9223330.1 homoserine kinase [Cyanobacterium stanieri LEGE 03274]